MMHEIIEMQKLIIYFLTQLLPVSIDTLGVKQPNLASQFSFEQFEHSC